MVLLKERLRTLRNIQDRAEDIEALESDIREYEKAARASHSRADAIDAAVFDLKGVNPNVATKTDSRSPLQVIDSIETHAKIVTDALQSLRALLQE